MAQKASVVTTLKWGQAKAEVKLYKATQESKEAKYDSAGPNGGVLRVQTRAIEALAEEAIKADPLAVQPDPGTEAPADLGLGEPVTTSEGAPATTIQVLVEEGSGVVVEAEDVRKGIRREDGSFVDMTEGLAAIDAKIQADLKYLEILKFIDMRRVPRERVIGAYYLGTEEEGAPMVLRLLLEAMRKEDRVALVRWSTTKNAMLGVCVPYKGDRLLILKLEYANNWREAPPQALSLQQAAVSESQVEVACELVRAMSDTTIALTEIRDERVVMREELRAKAEAGEEFEVLVPEEAAEQDIMAAMEASLAQVA